jgi:cold shock CspA family protein
MVYVGEVKSYNPDRSFGFVRQLGPHPTEQFFHLDNVMGRIVLSPGDLVQFEIAPSRNRPGLTMAVNVRLIQREEIPADALTSGVRP